MTIDQLKAQRAQLLQNREHYAQLTLKTEGAIDLLDMLIDGMQKDVATGATSDNNELPQFEAVNADNDEK